MTNKLEKFKIICELCGSESILEKDDDGACGDPECCGESKEWIKVRCVNCKNHTTTLGIK